MSIEPRLWIAAKRLTMTRYFAISIAPRDKVTNHHADPGAAADHGGAHEHGIGSILDIGSSGGQFASPLFHRVGFAGQECLLDEEVMRFEDAPVGRNHVAGREHHQIAGHHFGHWYLCLLAIANHQCPQRYRLTQAGRRCAGTVLLDEIQLTLNSTIAAMMNKLVSLPVSAEIALATSSRMMSGLLKGERNCNHRGHT
jgi:hypothetical protein